MATLAWNVMGVGVGVVVVVVVGMVVIVVVLAIAGLAASSVALIASGLDCLIEIGACVVVI